MTSPAELPEPDSLQLLSTEDLEAVYHGLEDLFAEDKEPMPPWRDGDRAKLETLCACTEVEAFGVQKYPEFHVKVAKFFYSAAKLHAFPNGNKRFALTATIFFLIRNGFRLDEEVVGEAPGIARLVAAADPHQPWGEPDIVISLIADAFFKTSIVPLDGASS